MPRKRRVAKLVHRQLSWRDIGPSEMLNFWHGVQAPGQTFEGYLSDWAAVRVEGLADWQERRTKMRAHCRATVARRAQQLKQATTDSDRDLYGGLLATAEEWLEKEERRRWPFAEVAYQRVLAGEAPDGSDDEDEDEG